MGRIASTMGVGLCVVLLAISAGGCSSGTETSESGSASGDEPQKGSCCGSNQTAGCDDAACEEAVCALNPSCCEVVWDTLCVVDYVIAQDLCSGFCEPVDGGEDDAGEASGDAEEGSASGEEDAGEGSGGGVGEGGPCAFWDQDCQEGLNCYPAGGSDFQCKAPTNSKQSGELCDAHTDCEIERQICASGVCVDACSIDEFAANAPICVDDCEYGFDAVDIDAQLGQCLGDSTVGEWVQVLPDNISKENVFKGIWMSGVDDIHLAGANGVGVHHDGEFWDVVTEGFWANMNGIWGFAPDDVWSVGIAGQILHYNGNNWVEPGGCTTDSDCNDSDECTSETCSPEGECVYVSTGGAECCGGTVYTQSWDDGTLGGWMVVDLYDPPVAELDGGVLWNVVNVTGLDGSPRFTSPLHSLYFGNSDQPCLKDPALLCPSYVGNGGLVGSTATSPAFTLPPSGQATVSFEAFISTEAGPSFDLFTVNVVSNGSVTNVWSKDTIHTNFVPYSADLSEFVGKTIQLQLFFDSGDALFNETEGVYIDDIVVTSECGSTASTTATFPTLFDVWGSSPDNIYGVGIGGVVVHYDGTSWKEESFSTNEGPWDVLGMHGFESNQIAVGSDGLVLNINEGAVSNEITGVTAALSAVWGNSLVDMYAVGQSGVVLHRTASGWSTQVIGTAANLHGVWGAGSFEVLVVGDAGTIVRQQSGIWNPEASGVTVQLNDVWTLDSQNAWAVGAQGTILRNAGAGLGWIGDASGVANDLVAVHGSSADNVWSVGLQGKILKYDGANWADVSSPVTLDWADVWAGEVNKTVVVGAQGVIIRNDGEQWSEMVNPHAGTGITTIWGNSWDDLYAGGNGFIIHYDGNEEGAWTSHASTFAVQTWRGVCGSGPDNVFVVGAGGAIIRWDGKKWGGVPMEPDQPGDAENPPEPITDLFYGCWALDGDSAWAVGENGRVVELDGGQFKKSDNPIPVSLRKVYAPKKNLVFAVGIEGLILTSRGVGTKWQPMNSGSVAGLFGIHGTSLEDITAVGDLGTILRFIPWDAAYDGEE